MFRAHGYLILSGVTESADFFLSIGMVALIPSSAKQNCAVTNHPSDLFHISVVFYLLTPSIKYGMFSSISASEKLWLCLVFFFLKIGTFSIKLCFYGKNGSNLFSVYYGSCEHFQFVFFFSCSDVLLLSFSLRRSL